MKLSSGISLVVLIAAGSALAQTEEKPRVALPEPKEERQAARGFTITILDYHQADKNADQFSSAIPELVRFFKMAIKNEVEINWNQLSLDKPRIAQASLLYMTGSYAILQFSEAQKQALGEYLKSGGLLFADDIRHSDATNGLDGKDAGVQGTPFDRQFKALIKDPLVLGEAGARWQKIPRDHPLYSSYFDFPDGPPMGGAPGGNVFDLEMLQLRGRVAAVFSDLNISWYWGDPLADARESGLRFGVNLIVFAMTQRAAVGGAPGQKRDTR